MQMVSVGGILRLIYKRASQLEFSQRSQICFKSIDFNVLSLLKENSRCFDVQQWKVLPCQSNLSVVCWNGVATAQEKSMSQNSKPSSHWLLWYLYTINSSSHMPHADRRWLKRLNEDFFPGGNLYSVLTSASSSSLDSDMLWFGYVWEMAVVFAFDGMRASQWCVYYTHGGRCMHASPDMRDV